MQRFDEAKFRELVLYIASKSKGDPRFGWVKLNKILYYSDFEAFRRLGEPITGATYRKMAEGPAPLQMPSQRRTMLDSGAISLDECRYFTGGLPRVTSLRPSQQELFSHEELAIVDQVIQGMWHMTERESAEFSQRELGWQAAGSGEEIPYPTVWLSSDPLPQEAEEHAAELAGKIGSR